jgi:hypothetical protein
MVSNSKNDDDYQFARTKATWKANFAQIHPHLVERDKPNKSESVGQNGRHFKMAANIKIKKIKIFWLISFH